MVVMRFSVDSWVLLLKCLMENGFNSRDGKGGRRARSWIGKSRLTHVGNRGALVAIGGAGIGVDVVALFSGFDHVVDVWCALHEEGVEVAQGLEMLVDVE